MTTAGTYPTVAGLRPLLLRFKNHGGFFLYLRPFGAPPTGSATKLPFSLCVTSRAHRCGTSYFHDDPVAT